MQIILIAILGVVFMQLNSFGEAQCEASYNKHRHRHGEREEAKCDCDPAANMPYVENPPKGFDKKVGAKHWLPCTPGASASPVLGQPFATCYHNNGGTPQWRVCGDCEPNGGSLPPTTTQPPFPSVPTGPQATTQGVIVTTQGGGSGCTSPQFNFKFSGNQVHSDSFTITDNKVATKFNGFQDIYGLNIEGQGSCKRVLNITYRIMRTEKEGQGIACGVCLNANDIYIAPEKRAKCWLAIGNRGQFYDDGAFRGVSGSSLIGLEMNVIETVVDGSRSPPTFALSANGVAVWGKQNMQLSSDEVERLVPFCGLQYKDTIQLI